VVVVATVVVVRKRVVGSCGFVPATATDNTISRKNSVNCDITEEVLLITDFKIP
jgi:hypothetical protein